MKRYDSYIDSGIQVLGKVPSSWKKSKFKFQHVEQEERVGEDSNEYDLLSLTKKGIILRDIESGKGKFPESFDTYKKVKKNDLIFCLYDIEETPRTVGLSELNGMITGSYKIFSSKDVITKFTYYTFLVIDDVKGLKPYYTGLRNVVRPETFKSLPFFIPSISEQKQIVSFLDTKTSLIDSLIEKTQRKIELLKEKRTSLIKEIVTKGLNPNVEMKDSGVEWIGEIPIHWELKKIKHLKSSEKYSLVDGPFGSNLKSIHYVDDGDVYVIESGFITSGKFKYVRKFKTITEEHFETIKRSQCKEGDLIISKIGEYYGMSGILPKLDKKSVISGNSLSLTLNKDTNTEFIHQVLIQHRINGTFKKEVQQTGQPFISLGVINNLVIPTPDLNEQQQIVEYLDEQIQKIDKTISIEEKRIELLKEYRQSLISEVVTGKRKVV